MEISGSRCSASQGWSATKMSAASGKGVRPGPQFADFGLLGQEELLGEGMVVPGVISKMSWSDVAALSW